MKEVFVDREYSDYFPFYEDAVVIDIGANVGYFSIFAANNIGSKGKVIAIEPEANNYSLLVSNTRYVRNKVSIENSAISHEVGQSYLYLSESLNHTLVSCRESPKVPIQTQTLENLLSCYNLDHVDFLKMDCEGAEYEILKYMPSDVFAKISVISMEFHDNKDQRLNGKWIADILEDHGFVVKKFCYSSSNFGLNFGKIIGVRKYD